MKECANNPQFRPPAEADSVIIQVDQGCPYNNCTFCGMYKGTKFARREVAHIRRIIEAEAAYEPEARRVFLADGDVMRRSFGELREILEMLATHFVQLSRVNVYATGKAILSKTPDELRALRELKLHTLYMGLESGDDETLRRTRKAESAAEMIEAGRRAQEAGLRVSVMILLGLGGRERTKIHASATASALNAMQPRLLSALRVVPIPGTELHDQAKSGQFVQLTEFEAVQELSLILSQLELENTVFRANHASNIVPMEGRLPRDRERLLGALNDLMSSGHLDRQSPGPMPLWL